MTSTITHAEAVKEIRAIAKKNGMTFKKQNATINGAQAYQFVNRKSGRVVGYNYKLWTAYQDCMSGYVEKMNF